MTNPAIRFTDDHPLWPRAVEIYQERGGIAATDFLCEHGIPMNAAAFRSKMMRKNIKTQAVGGAKGSRLWTLAEVATLADLYADPLTPLSELVQQLGHTRDAIRNKAQSLGIVRGINPSPLPRLLLPRIEIDAPLLVIADAHVPFQHKEWLDRCITLALAWGARDVLLAGDAIDAQALSRFETFDHPSSEEEIEVWGFFEQSLLRYFSHLHWFLGNHEARWGKVVNHKVPLYQLIERQFVQVRERVTVYNSFVVDVGDDWRVEHPKGSGKNIAIDLVSRHLKNVAVAHTHHSSSGRDRSGRYFGVRIGAGCDHTRMPYCTRITSDVGEAMGNGALILVPGKLRTLHYNLEPEMDLEVMAKMYRPSMWKKEQAA